MSSLIRLFKPLILIIVFFLLVIEMGCKKNNLLDEYYLGDLIYCNPYQGTEVLVFKSSMGDVFSLHSNGRNRKTIKNYVSVNSNDYYITEEDFCSFIDSTNNYSIFITMKTYRNDPPILGFSFSNYYLDKTGEFNAYSRFILPLNESNLQSGQEYFDSISVGDRYYYQVFSGPCELYFPSGNEGDTSHFLSELYYNKQEGLIKLDFSNGEVWELKDF